MNSSIKTKDQLLEECFERGLPVLEDDSVEQLQALLENDDFYDEEYDEYFEEDEFLGDEYYNEDEY